MSFKCCYCIFLNYLLRQLFPNTHHLLGEKVVTQILINYFPSHLKTMLSCSRFPYSGYSLPKIAPQPPVLQGIMALLVQPLPIALELKHWQLSCISSLHFFQLNGLLSYNRVNIRSGDEES